MTEIEYFLNLHPEIKNTLSSFEYFQTAGLVGGFATIPALHGNTFRIEILANFVAAACKGDVKPSPEDIQRLIGPLMQDSPLTRFEDPPEDVFSAYISTEFGGFRVFAGIFANGYFWLERLIAFLYEKRNYPTFSDTLDSVVALLRLSEAVADRLDIPRYEQGSGTSISEINFCSEDIIDRADSVVFSDADLSVLQIERSQISRFELKESDRVELYDKPLYGSPLEAKPLVRTQNGIILAAPSFVCRAAIMLILEEVGPKLGGWSDTFFGVESAGFFVNDVIQHLGIQQISINPPTPPDSLPPLFPYFGQFDYGKPVLALVFCAKLTGDVGLDVSESFTDVQIRDLETYISSCCELLEKVEGFTGGLVLVGMASVGRSMFVGFEQLPEKWHLFSAGLCDWQALQEEPGFDALRLWRMAQQLDHVRRIGIQVVNDCGFLNLYAFWKQHNFTLIPDGVDVSNKRNVFYLPPGCSHSLSVELHRMSDRHCLLSHEGLRWVSLRRVGQSLNPDYNSNKVYADCSLLREGKLLGCSESGQITWWVACSEDRAHAAAISTQYDLWDCLLHWVDRIIPVVEEYLNFGGIKSVKVELKLPHIAEWSDVLDGDGPASNTMDGLALETCKKSNVLTLTLQEVFISVFHQPENFAEQQIVEMLLRGAAEICDCPEGSLDFCALVNQVTNGNDARFFHVTKANSLEAVLAKPGRSEPTFVPEEDINNVQIGLADLVGRPPEASLSNRDKMVTFLTKVVEKLWERIELRLSSVSIHAVVGQSFSHIDEISRDSNRWRTSTRALQALENNEPWLLDKLRTQQNKLTSATNANRLLIETAVYAASSISKRLISNSEHTLILAEIVVMLEIANHRDAVAAGITPPNIVVHPNGSIEIDETFVFEVFAPYLTSQVDDSIDHAAESYDDLFPKKKAVGKDSDVEAGDIERFRIAFRAEFGYEFDALLDVVEIFDQFAIKSGDSGGALTLPQLRELIKTSGGLNGNQASKFVDRFTLPIRKGWNKELKGFKEEDVFPWRYGRGLSLLLRPFVEVEKNPTVLFVSATHLHRWARHTINTLHAGRLPERFFKSAEMKGYLGKTANKRGHDFEGKVAEVFRQVGIECEVNVSMNELDALDEPQSNDVDVVAWDRDSGIVWLVECKCLKNALTIRDVIQMVDEFKGEGQDRLGRHIRRVDWIRDNPEAISKKTGMSVSSITWVSILVTSDRVPMSFIDQIEFPAKQVVPIQELRGILSSRV